MMILLWGDQDEELYPISSHLLEKDGKSRNHGGEPLTRAASDKTTTDSVDHWDRTCDSDEVLAGSSRMMHCSDRDSCS
jgi:hypothetical protein